LVGGGGGGGGALGALTVKVTDPRASVPPSPLAVSVYRVVSGGLIRRLPLALTVPIPLSIDTADEFRTSHFNVADCPRSMVEGSTSNVATVGRAGAGGGGVDVVAAGGGGGGGGGTFFLQPAAPSASTAANVRTPNCCVLILNLAPLPLSLIYLLCPNRFFVATLRCQLL
jgi:hypothetical protein